MTDRGSTEAFVTLATNDTYSLGCLVLGSSLRRVGTTKQLAVMVTTGVSNPMRTQLAQVFDYVEEVDILDSRDPVNLALLGRPDLNVTFTKLHCWRLTQFTKAVFLDADVIVIQNVDDLLDREELSAAPDAGWPDCFNSGVFVFKPSRDTYQSLIRFATDRGSFDGGDQGLLNMYFNDWATADIKKHLPFVYNVVSQAFYSYLPAFKQFQDTVKIVHFIGAVKPWHHTYNTMTGTVTVLPGTGHSQTFLQLWWNIFIDRVQPTLDPSLTVTVVNSPPNSPEPLPGDSPDKGDTVHAVFPFVPPKLDHVFYKAFSAALTNLPNIDNNGCDKGEHGGELNIVEVPMISRAYTELESHYSEEPISHVDPESPPPSAYDAIKITAGWERGSRPLPVSVLSTITKDLDTKQSVADPRAESPASVLQSNNELTNEEPGIMERNNSSTDAIEGGLVGELAQMTLHAGPASPTVFLSDQERKLNWEKGQIDYMGQDAFTNIQRKLEESLNSEEPRETAASTSSPFTPVQPEVKSTAAPTPIIKVVAVPAVKAVAVPAVKAVATVPAPVKTVTAPAPISKTSATTIPATTAKTPVAPTKVVPSPKPEPVKTPMSPVKPSPAPVVDPKSKTSAVAASAKVVAPTGTSKAPASKALAPATKAPATKAPAPATKTPAPSTKAPAPSTKAPATATKAPAPATKAPAPATKAPAPAAKTPAPASSKSSSWVKK